MFTCENFDVVPDILVIGKGLGGGILPLAAVIAYLLFAQVPDGWTVAGAAIIFAATLYIAARERQTRTGRVGALGVDRGQNQIGGRC